MALDAANSAMVCQLSEVGKPLHQMSLSEARAFIATLRPLSGRGPEMLRIEEHHVGPDATVLIRLLVPCEHPRGLILYCHGGGWALMSINDFETVGRLIAQLTGCCVALVDYRLAPENPFPAGLEDAWWALLWADTQRQRLMGSAQAPLLVAGDSAGGNLAAVLAQRAARIGAPTLTQQVLIYPVTQPHPDTPSYLDADNQSFISRHDMAWFWDLYIPDPSARLHPEASPLFAEDLSNVAPAVLVSAEHDVLRDEGEAYAQRLRDVGVKVTARRFDGQVHGFLPLFELLPQSHAALRFVVDAIEQQLSKSE